MLGTPLPEAWNPILSIDAIRLTVSKLWDIPGMTVNKLSYLILSTFHAAEKLKDGKEDIFGI